MLKIAQFTSSATKGDVYVCLGFVPDYVKVLLNVTGTNSDVLEWFNPATITLFPASVLSTGGDDGVRIKDTDAADIITAYAGGDKIVGADNEATDDPKYVDHTGALIADGKYTPAGIWIADEYQTNSGINIVLAFKNS